MCVWERERDLKLPLTCAKYECKMVDCINSIISIKKRNIHKDTNCCKDCNTLINFIFVCWNNHWRSRAASATIIVTGIISINKYIDHLWSHACILFLLQTSIQLKSNSPLLILEPFSQKSLNSLVFLVLIPKISTTLKQAVYELESRYLIIYSLTTGNRERHNMLGLISSFSIISYHNPKFIFDSYFTLPCRKVIKEAHCTVFMTIYNSRKLIYGSQSRKSRAA